MADALSLRDEEGEFSAISLPRWLDWSVLQGQIKADPPLAKIIGDLENGRPGPKHYTLVRGVLF